VVRSVLRAFPADRAAAWFDSLGVALHEEEDGKLFPDTNSSRTVLDALLAECGRRGVHLETVARVTDVQRDDRGFVVTASERTWRARALVLATGGKSLPKSGSDGFGYELARRLGHAIVDTTPALAPLVLEKGPHAALSGVSQQAVLTLEVDGRAAIRLEGALLWTHFGVSGPVALNLSRHWHRARLAGSAVDVLLNMCPGDTFESIDAWLQEQSRGRPRARVLTLLATVVPGAVAEVCVDAAGVEPDVTAAHLTRDGRRAIAHALTATRLPVIDSRGYGHAEVTAGGVPLDEIDPATMASRACPGLYLTGEILDVDGRLGGFNFQWAWSSAWVAGHAIARALTR
jgi:predicted Rossmann fold flavoprotein